MSDTRAATPCDSGSVVPAAPPTHVPHQNAPTVRFPCPPEPSVAYARAAAATPQYRRMASGITLEYLTHGNATGVPVVMLHGITDSWKSFAPVLPYLPESVRAIVPSLRGHGGSDRPARDYTMRSMAADVVALLDALHVPAATVVGHSMGAAVAMRLAADHAGRVRGLMLIGAFAQWLPNTSLDEMDQAVAHLGDPVPEAFARGFQESTTAPPVPAAFITTMVSESLKLPAAVWQGAVAGFRGDDPSADVAALATPVRLIWGARDPFVPRRDALALLEALPASTLDTYESAGHAVHWEEPARVARAITALALDAHQPAR